MGATAARRMDADEFLRWSLGREGTWELVDCLPRLKRPGMMAGTNYAHEIVRGNIEFGLRSRLQGRCRVLSDAIATRVSSSKLRRPDVTVDCGKPTKEALEAVKPTVLFEIYSASTRKVDVHEKPYEYRSIKSLKHFVMVEPGVAACTVWSRSEDGSWDSMPVIGLGSTIRLPGIAVELPMSEVYAGVEDLEED